MRGIVLCSNPMPSDLPFAELEVALSEAMGFKKAIRHVDPRAHQDDLTLAISSADSVHIASHGEARLGRAASNAIGLTFDGHEVHIDASMLVRVEKRSREIALLNACHGNTGSLYEFGTFSSIAQGFHRAGFRIVISSTTAVEDHDAFLLATRLYPAMAQSGMSGALVDEALRRSVTASEVEVFCMALSAAGRKDLASAATVLYRAGQLGTSLREYVVWE